MEAAPSYCNACKVDHRPGCQSGRVRLDSLGRFFCKSCLVSHRPQCPVEARPPPRKPPIWCGRCNASHPAGACPLRTPWINGRKSGRGRGGNTWRKIRQRIFERDDYLCQEHLKRGKLVPVGLSGAGHGYCDHIVPESEGGTDDDDNLQTLCASCHSSKTAKESARARARKRKACGGA